MITKIIQQQDGQYTFCIGKCKYICEDRKSLAEIRTDFLRQQTRSKVK